MKKHFKTISEFFLVSTLLLSAGSVRGAAIAAVTPAAATNAVVAEPVVRKSVFEDDVKNGKDPFFPKSTRRSQTLPNTPQTASPVVQLALKGISGSVDRRFALINNQTIAVGEIAVVKVPGGLVKVHCWEIRDNSVLISVEGSSEKKELRLRDNL